MWSSDEWLSRSTCPLNINHTCVKANPLFGSGKSFDRGVFFCLRACLCILCLNAVTAQSLNKMYNLRKSKAERETHRVTLWTFTLFKLNGLEKWPSFSVATRRCYVAYDARMHRFYVIEITHSITTITYTLLVSCLLAHWWISV